MVVVGRSGVRYSSPRGRPLFGGDSRERKLDLNAPTLHETMTHEEKCKFYFDFYVEAITMIGKDSNSAAAYKRKLKSCPEYHQQLREFDNSKCAREAPLVKDAPLDLTCKNYESWSLEKRCSYLCTRYHEAIYYIGEKSWYADGLKKRIVAESCPQEFRV